MTKFMRVVLKALKNNGDMTAAELASLLSQPEWYIIRNGIFPLHKHSLIRVSSWIPRVSDDNLIPVLSVSGGLNAPKPPARQPENTA